MQEWKKVVTPGHVLVARMNALTWVGAVLLIFLLASIARDIAGNTFLLKERLAAVSQANPSLFERLTVDPLETIKSFFRKKAKTADQPRPELDQNAAFSIQPVPATGVSTQNLTRPADLKEFVVDNVKSLNATGKLSGAYPACDRLDDLRKPWVNSKTGQPDTPRCLTSATGDTIWMASIIGSADGYTVIPWLGVFHKTDGKWAYQNANILPAASAKLDGFGSVDFAMIPYQIQTDFPYLIAQPAKSESEEGGK